MSIYHIYSQNYDMAYLRKITCQYSSIDNSFQKKKKKFLKLRFTIFRIFVKNNVLRMCMKFLYVYGLFNIVKIKIYVKYLNHFIFMA